MTPASDSTGLSQIGLGKQPPLPNRDAGGGQQLRIPESGWPVYDLVVIGGGINGTGIARDAARRGLKVLLLEKNDFGAGTSAYSSRLIHGGLRYLANFEFDLVRESLQERELLLHSAPHLVQPITMAIPVYRGGQNPVWKIEAGMWLYDLLSWGKHMPSHRLLSREQFLRAYPGINPEGLQGGPVYYDAQAMLPERICVENAMAALQTGHASLLNHAQVQSFQMDRQGIRSLTFEDLLSGQTHTVLGKVYINASGPWVDEIIRLAAELKPTQPRLGGTKGTHIVVRRFPGAPQTAIYAEARADGRPFFIIPWRDDTVLIGTTDTPYEGSLDHVIPTAKEVAYLLAETNHVLPQAQLSEENVLYAYAGVRPLPFAQGKRAGQITRKHWIVDHAQDHDLPLPGLLSVIGGKLTTYRNLAEETVDYAAIHYHLQLTNDIPVPPSDTRHAPLPGGRNEQGNPLENWENYLAQKTQELAQRTTLNPEPIRRLLTLYGSQAEKIVAIIGENPNWSQSLSPQSNIIAAQVVYAVRQEMACTTEDVMLRRLGCGLDPDLGLSVLEPLASLMGHLLGWSDTTIQAEIRDYKKHIEERNLAFKRGAYAPL